MKCSICKAVCVLKMKYISHREIKFPSLLKIQQSTYMLKELKELTIRKNLLKSGRSGRRRLAFKISMTRKIGPIFFAEQFSLCQTILFSLY